MTRIAVLLTCHNRRDKTVACLEALFACPLPQDVALHAILVDDGSRDGTAQAVQARWPQVEVLAGDGSLYWNGGMRRAWERAFQTGFDAYLWLNDDTLLDPASIGTMVRTWREAGAASPIVVGTTRDPVTGAATYGGRVSPKRWKPFLLELVQPSDVPQPCDTMNGNCVLVPDRVARAVGNLEAAFDHAMGDNDYGLRARRAGFPLRVAPGFVGTCGKNSIRGTYLDQALSLSERWRRMLQPKGLPPRGWWVLTRRHGGPLWPVYFAWPYLRLLLRR